MPRFIDLSTLVLLTIILAGVASVVYRLYRAKKSDGNIDDDEKEKLFQFTRDLTFKIMMEAIEIQKQKNAGDQFLRQYILSKVTMLVNQSSILTDSEKEIIVVYLIETAVDTVLKLLGYNVVEIKNEIAEASYEQLESYEAGPIMHQVFDK